MGAPPVAGRELTCASPGADGEINCIQEFYKLPADKRPNAKDCIFFATHEPCSLCECTASRAILPAKDRS